MRRKTFDVLFDTRVGMTALVKQPCLWRSGFYYTLSVGLFTGVVSNSWLIHEPLEVRFAIVVALIIILGAAISMYGFLLHGILETFGALAGDAKGLVCLLGYTTLPFLVLTPCALLAGKLGFDGLLLLAAVTLIVCCWMLYLLVRSLEVVYIIDFKRAAATVLFSLLLVYIVIVLPWQVGFNLLLRHF
ncbi:MAG: YIP1 family protein [Phascolarctobacterium sp.]|nr:YIP1 family protein [Phascolarctobacterium sp.]